MVTAAMKLKDAYSLEEKLPSEPPGKPDQPRQLLKKQRYYIANKSPSSQGYVFPVIMYGCESWTIKKVERQRIDTFELVLEKTLESPLDCKEIQPVHSEGDQS